MKKIFITASTLLSIIFTNGQQKEGKVTYQRTVQLQMRVQGMGSEIEQMMPHTRTDKFELLFGNNKSLWKIAEDDTPQDDQISGNGFQIRMVGAGTDDVTFYNFDEGRSVELRDLADKKYILQDSIRKLSWKLSDETKNILGHICRKAVSQRISNVMRMIMNNGTMERKEMADTSNMVAWFTTDFPVSAGPEVQGQLPGLILELNINSGRTLYTALEISPKIDLASIKEPTKGKKVTLDEFNKERDKMMEQMRHNNGGPGRTVRFNN